MKCPRCGSNNVDKLDTDLEDEETYGRLDCDCWFTIHSEPFTALVEELKYEKTITHDLN